MSELNATGQSLESMSQPGLTQVPHAWAGGQAAFLLEPAGAVCKGPSGPRDGSTGLRWVKAESRAP